MKRFTNFLSEKILSPGFNPNHEKYRSYFRDQIHDILHKSYAAVPGGYGGVGSGSKEERDLIHSDIHNPEHKLKITKRGNTVTSVQIYKEDEYGRKGIGGGTNGTPQGKRDFIKTTTDDIKHRYVRGEVSGAPRKIMHNLGASEIPFEIAKKTLRGKHLTQVGTSNSYVRDIGGHPHEKTLMGRIKPVDKG